MNMHFFFSGRLSREESASALLASLIEQREDFREFFFSLVQISKPEGSFAINTEVQDVDIRIDYSNGNNTYVILVENKIRAGAIQQNQLVRYYEKEDTRNEGAIISTVFITPHQSTGDSEIERLENILKNGDTVNKISWCDDLCDYRTLLRDDDPDKQLIESAMGSIINIIEESEKEKYPLLYGRKKIQEIASLVLKDLDTGICKFMIWRGKDYFDIYTVGTDIGIDFLLKFEVEPKEPFSPIGLSDDRNLQVTVSSLLGLSVKGKKNRDICSIWNSITESGQLKILPEGLHRPEGHRFAFHFEVVGDSAAIRIHAVRIANSVIDFLLRNRLLKEE